MTDPNILQTARNGKLMDRVITALSAPDFWTKPLHNSGFGIGLAIGGAVGFVLSFYRFPVRNCSYNLGLFLSALIWMPSMLLGAFIGQLVEIWLGR